MKNFQKIRFPAFPKRGILKPCIAFVSWTKVQGFDKAVIKEKSKYLYLALRRRYLFRFQKKYVLESISLRKGYCKRCPCCYTPGLFSKSGRCPHLRGKSCDLYHDSKMPFWCKNYPMDERDKTPFGGKNCGYSWNKKDLEKLKKKYRFTF